MVGYLVLFKHVVVFLMHLTNDMGGNLLLCRTLFMKHRKLSGQIPSTMFLYIIAFVGKMTGTIAFWTSIHCGKISFSAPVQFTSFIINIAYVCKINLHPMTILCWFINHPLFCVLASMGHGFLNFVCTYI